MIILAPFVPDKALTWAEGLAFNLLTSSGEIVDGKISHLTQGPYEWTLSDQNRPCSASPVTLQRDTLKGNLVF